MSDDGKGSGSPVQTDNGDKKQSPQDETHTWATLEELDHDESILLNDRRIQETILKEIDKNESSPPPIVTRSGLWNFILAIIALTSSALVTLALVVVAYLVVTHAFAPQRLHYSMPMLLELRGNDLVSNISLNSLSQYYADGQIQSMLVLDQDGQAEYQKALVSPGQVMDIWMEIEVPSEYEKLHPERRYAHVSASMSTYGGKLVGRAAKPVWLNGRQSSASALLFGPWRWVGLLPRSHRVIVSLFSRYVEKGSQPALFLSSEIKARSPPGPEILGASIHIALKATVLQKILFYGRPQSLVGKMMGTVSVIVIVGGLGVVFSCIQAYNGSKDTQVQEDADSETSSLLDDVLSTPSKSLQGDTDRLYSPWKAKSPDKPSPRKVKKSLENVYKSPQKSPQKTIA